VLLCQSKAVRLDLVRIGDAVRSIKGRAGRILLVLDVAGQTLDIDVVAIGRII